MERGANWLWVRVGQVALLASMATAQVSGIYVEYYHDNNPFDGWAAVPGFPSRHGRDPDWDPEPGLPSGSNISISNGGIVPYRVFATSPTTTDIGDISISLQDGNYHGFLTVGRFTDSNRTPTAGKRLDAAGGRDIGRISTYLGDIEIQAYATRDFTNQISAWQVVRLDALGSLGSHVIHDGGEPNSPVSLGRVEVGSIGVAASITAFRGDIVIVTATDGSIAGPILATTGHINTVRTLSPSGDITGSIEAGGMIQNVFSGRNIAGDISAGPNDHIWWVDAPNGDIGATGSQNWVTIEAGTRIQKLYAKNIYAAIGSTSVSGCDVERVVAYTGVFEGMIDAQEIHDTDGNQDKEGVIRGKAGMNASILTSGDIREAVQVLDGDFVGSIECEDLTGDTNPDDVNFSGYIDIRENATTGAGGSFYGDVLVHGSVDGPLTWVEIDNTYDGTFAIGDNLADEFRVLGDPLQGQGLKGQVIINANDNGGAWTADVITGGGTLDPIPYYDNPSSTIGGGAVGLVPYYLQYQDCDPVGVKFQEDMGTGLDGLDPCEEGYHGIVLIHPADPMPTVTLRHYGPIEQHGTGLPFTVKRRSLGVIDCQWSDISSSFTHTLTPGDDRGVTISGPFIVGFDYLIEPRMNNGVQQDYLYCGGLDPSVGEVSLYPYDYRLRVTWSQDITLNGQLQPSDISAWLADPVDTTLDGVADTADLIDVTEAVANSGG